MSGAASAAWLLVAAAGTATLRWAGMSQDPGSAALIGLQLLHGVTFGATHLGSIFLLSRLAPGRMQASAQAWLAGGWAGVMALLTTLSGQLYESWGEQIYLVMTAVAAMGLVLLVLVAFGLSRMTAGEPPIAARRFPNNGMIGPELGF
jgi:PPP family 3-phenylpropionic acid transporter